MAMDHAALATELQTDPTGIGYTPASGDDQAQVDLIETVVAGSSLTVATITAAVAQQAIVATEYMALSAARRALWGAILTAGLNGGIPVFHANIRAQVLEVWADGSTTRANLGALQTQDGTRSEVLFGTGVVTTVRDVAIALRGV